MSRTWSRWREDIGVNAGGAGRGAGGAGAMSRPLLITDCDEVLLHMVAHFQDWLAEAHDIHFAFETGQLRRRADRSRRAARLVAEDGSGRCSTRFFRERNAPPDPGAGRDRGAAAGSARRPTSSSSPISATRRIRWRVAQLARHGIRHEVVCNQGGKGVPARAIIERHRPSATVFVDDLPVHHAVGRQACARGVAAAHGRRAAAARPTSPTRRAAHARIDDWPTATRLDIGPVRGASA